MSRRELVRLLVDVESSELGHGQRLKCRTYMVGDEAAIGKHFDRYSPGRLYRNAVTPVRGWSTLSALDTGLDHIMDAIAILTGASSGIGAAAAEQFMGKGCAVINISRRDCPVAGVETLSTDLSDSASLTQTCATLVARLTEHSGTPVCLVHNASLMLKDRCDTTEDDTLAQVLAVNVSGINALNRTLLPIMPRGSSVLYVGSTLSEKAVAGAYSYIVSKHAQLGMMRATCQDLMGRGIHTALICPGFTDTTMLRQHVGQDESVLASLGAMNSFGRLVSPDEIADMIVWAHEHPVINGSVLHGNLGQVEH